MKRLPGSILVLVMVAGCGGPRAPAVPAPAEPAAAAACNEYQAAIRRYADTRAAREGKPTIAQHLARHFPDGRVSWLMKEADYQRYVVEPAARTWARCNCSGCYLFAAPAAVLRAHVERSMVGDRHDAAALGRALGLPAASLEGPLRMMTLDVGKAGSCVRLPVCADLGAAPECKAAADTACFEFGGYTRGGVPEVLVIDAPVDQTTIEVVP